MRPLLGPHRGARGLRLVVVLMPVELFERGHRRENEGGPQAAGEETQDADLPVDTDIVPR